jgi:large-conductance mechanosensitive channel
MIQTASTTCIANNYQDLNPDPRITDMEITDWRCSTTYQIASTTASFSYGEIINSLFLFLIFIFLIFSFFVFKFLGIKIHKNI